MKIGPWMKEWCLLISLAEELGSGPRPRGFVIIVAAVVSRIPQNQVKGLWTSA